MLYEISIISTDTWETGQWFCPFNNCIKGFWIFTDEKKILTPFFKRRHYGSDYCWWKAMFSMCVRSIICKIHIPVGPIFGPNNWEQCSPHHRSPSTCSTGAVHTPEDEEAQDLAGTLAELRHVEPGAHHARDVLHHQPTTKQCWQSVCKLQATIWILLRDIWYAQLNC